MKKLSQINEGVMTNTIRRFHTGEVRKQDSINQPKIVDLGLSVKWASFNLGAQSPEEYGDYFTWGETEGFSGDDNSRIFDKDNYKANDYKEPVLDSEHDAATQILGKNWRMPTKEEWEELNKNITSTWETLNGVKGRKYTAENGNWIFLPAAGYRYYINRFYVSTFGLYWSSSIYESHTGYSYSVYFDNNNHILNYNNSYHGFSVRPIYTN